MHEHNLTKVYAITEKYTNAHARTHIHEHTHLHCHADCRHPFRADNEAHSCDSSPKMKHPIRMLIRCAQIEHKENVEGLWCVLVVN